MEDFTAHIQTLPIKEEDKEYLLKRFKDEQKKNTILEFKFMRTEVDKTAITNILNASIDEINKQKKIIEDSKDKINLTLTEVDKQKKLVDVKNTALNKLLNDLREAQQQLVMSEKMASLGQLTAGVAHEINNPINFVSANIKPLKEDLLELMESIHQYEAIIKENKLQPIFEKVSQFNAKNDLAYTMQEIHELIKGIEEGARRTAEIVKGLRNFSRMDQNVVKKANINEGLDATLALLHSVYKDHIEITKDYGALTEVECFPGEINQVFMNILSNAIQAITGRGKIHIRTWQENKVVKIAIKDNGSGMDEVTKNKVFDPFFTTKDVGKGTGLGLSISYGIIEKHSGKIQLSSALGKGTEFTIQLPMVQNKHFEIKKDIRK